MRRISLEKAIKRCEGQLTTLHPLEIEKRRVILRTIAETRMAQRQMDFLGGFVEAFIINNVIVCRQFIVRTKEIHWYKAHQGNLILLTDNTELETTYASNYSLG